jgi:putative endonuclease
MFKMRSFSRFCSFRMTREGIVSWVVYILECADGTLYTGITNNLEKRLAAHEVGAGAKYTKGRGPFRLVFREDYADRSDASKRERMIKKMSRAEKKTLFVLDKYSLSQIN